MVDPIVQSIERMLQLVGSAVLGITKPAVNLLSNPFPWVKNLSENWQIAIFLSFISILCVILAFLLPRMFPEKKVKEKHKPYSEAKSTKPRELVNQFIKNILEDPRNSNK